MFERTLTSSWSERSRRGWTTLTSFGLQALVGGTLLLFPILRPQGLPLFRQLSTPVSLGRPTEQPQFVRARRGGGTTVPIDPAQIVLRQPTQIQRISSGER